MTSTTLLPARAPTPGRAWRPLDGDGLRALMATVAEPVVVVTGQDSDGHGVGLTISSFTSVSLRPGLVLFCVASGSRTWARIAPTGRFAVNVLAAGQEDLARRFAAPVDRFAGTRRETSPEGVPVLADALSSVVCRVSAVHPAGDHQIVVGLVGRAVTRRAAAPLLARHTRRAADPGRRPA